MARQKPLPPPIADCPLCGRTVEALRLDKHERAHITVQADTRPSASDPYRDRPESARRQTIVYELDVLSVGFESDGALRGHAETFFPRAIVKVAGELPREASLHYVPFRHYTLGQYVPILVSLLVVAHL